jgi:hypothetical protein
MALRSGRDLGAETSARDLAEAAAYYLHLAVRTSQLSGAGLGLWTGVDLPGGTAVALYHGVLHPRISRTLSDSVAGFNAKMDIDAGPVLQLVVSGRANLGRYINDARGALGGSNLAFSASLRDADGPCLVMTTTRAVKAGSELFVSYGAPFWASKVRRDGVESILYSGAHLNEGIAAPDAPAVESTSGTEQLLGMLTVVML